MAVREDDYKFLQIVDAMASINQRVNLIGVVVDTSIPKQSKGTDCFCTIRIVDESHSTRGISVNIFAENMERLPLVESTGDIIQVSRVVMKTHGGEVYALFNKKFSSFALFEGKHSTNFVPYQVSPNFHPRNQDKKFIAGLRKWLVDNQPDTGSDESLSLKDIREGERNNLVCKVLHIFEVTKDDWLVLVWDGTDTPPVTILSKLEDEMEHPLPLQLESSPLSRDVLCSFPAVGTVLRVIVGQSNEKLGLHLLKVGRWVKFVNTSFQCHAGLWRGLLMPFTRLQYLPDDDHLVLQSQRLYNERIHSRWARMPLLSFPWSSHITETDYEDVPFVTLMNILTYAESLVPASQKKERRRTKKQRRKRDEETEEIRRRRKKERDEGEAKEERLGTQSLTLKSKSRSYAIVVGARSRADLVTAKFRCVVRVVAAFPWRAENFRSPLGTYRIRLTLEDPTARIHAYVYAEDGEKLFGGYPSLDGMTRMRNILLGVSESGGKEIEDAPRNPPWVQCCIKSYYLAKDDIWGSRNYRIFATKFVK